MEIIVESDLTQIEAMLSDAALDAANELLTEHVKQSVDEADGQYTSKTTGETRSGYTPFATGALRQSSYLSGKNEFTYSEDYADYAGYVYNGTSKMEGYPWFEVAKSEQLDNWVDKAAELILGE